MTSSFAKRILTYYKDLKFEEPLPNGVSIMNPFQEHEFVRKISATFYEKYYNDNHKRHLILGINPGRLGAGSTGVPFTDTKRMKEFCKIEIGEIQTHEPSSVFIYEVIQAYGGPEKFYKKFYINSVFPLGFTIDQGGKKEVNYNYYDKKELQDIVFDFILWNIETQIELGCKTDKVFCLGTGKNFQFLKKLNDEKQFFDQVIPLDHPRYVMQYKSKTKEDYIIKYLDAFGLKT
jgi:hypothetical protein